MRTSHCWSYSQAPVLQLAGAEMKVHCVPHWWLNATSSLCCFYPPPPPPHPSLFQLSLSIIYPFASPPCPSLPAWFFYPFLHFLPLLVTPFISLSSSRSLSNSPLTLIFSILSSSPSHLSTFILLTPLPLSLPPLPLSCLPSNHRLILCFFISGDLACLAHCIYSALRWLPLFITYSGTRQGRRREPALRRIFLPALPAAVCRWILKHSRKIYCFRVFLFLLSFSVYSVLSTTPSKSSLTCSNWEDQRNGSPKALSRG